METLACALPFWAAALPVFIFPTFGKSATRNRTSELYEQNPAGATWGFGVVFSERALEFLRADDPDTADFIAPHMETWRNMTLDLKGEQVVLDGVGFSAIGRLKLLQLLQQRARSVGVELTFGKLVESLAEVGEADLVVGADGLNSAVRRACEGDFKTSLSYADNKFAWYGTTKAFATLSQTFVETDLGTFNAHHYRYAPGASTFLVECDRKTWDRYGMTTSVMSRWISPAYSRASRMALSGVDAASTV